MTEKKMVALVKISAVVACLILCACIVLLVSQLIYKNELKNKTESLHAELVYLQSQQNELNDYIEYKNSTEYVEQYAREVLGMTKEGEIKFVPKK